jgi:HSP20 family molecular chaperone IbpA
MKGKYMKNVEIQIVDSISVAIDEIQNHIRVRAYEKFLDRGFGPNLALNDWLDAERELICVLTANVTRQKDQIVAEIEVPNIHFETLRIQATAQDALVDVVVSDSSGPADSSLRRAFGVVRFDQPLDPAMLRASYGRGVLRLTAPTSGTNKLMRTA